MTDFRALCAELLQELSYATAWDYQKALKDQARVALAQPEPEGPTDEELNDLCADHGFVFDDNNGESLSILSDIVNAALARWGRSPQ
jgi:hypothetical protein